MSDQLNTLAKSANIEFVTRLEGGIYILRFRGVDVFRGTLGEVTAYLLGWKASSSYSSAFSEYR
jgi:hypothetical protein